MKQLAELIGASPALEHVRGQLQRLIARQQAGHRLPPILITGETGTGKGLVAHLLHRMSPRAGGPFVSVNCAAIPETLLEAELFGYERGAFTDARQSKPGLFQLADRGTIFLDEIGLLPAALQAKLLKALEERAVRRLGGTRSEPFDAWILSATNADLTVALRERRFREDLYHRLAVLTLRLPPLRERGEDILLLAEHFLARACSDYGLPAKRLAPATRTRLSAYAWPGNVRELANVMERAALLGETLDVTPEMLELSSGSSSGVVFTEAEHPGTTSLESSPRSRLLAVLEQHRWNISQTAAALGIARNTLRARIRKYGLGQGRSHPVTPGPAMAGPPAARGREAPVPIAPPPAQAAASAQLLEPVAATPAAFEAAPPTTRIRWERRQLALLRLLLEGPTGAEAVLDTSRVLEMLIDKVRSFGGRIEELSPTSLGAVFGLETMEEPARSAAHAAMAMRRLLTRGRHGEGGVVTARIGIHADVLLVGQAGSVQAVDAGAKRAAWTVLDALVHDGLAGTVRVTAGAAPLLQRRFVLAAAAASEPGLRSAYELAGAERAAIHSGGRLTDFVGRRQELDLLDTRFRAALGGHGQVIAISGEAGIGKSRLLHEFRQRLHAHPVTFLEAQCVSYGTTIPYLPILQLLRRAFGLDDADTPRVITRKLRRGLDRLGVTGRDAETAVLDLFGLAPSETVPGRSPQTLQARAREAIRRIIASASRRCPLIVIVEDLHWIDAASESLGQAFLQGIDALPVLVLLTYRSGYRQPWTDRSYVTQLALQRLSREESAGIVRALCAPTPLPPTLTELIVERADGNPFFLEELAHVVVAERHTGETDLVPETIQEVLLARINRLTPEARGLLESAAVLGRQVTHAVLRAMRGDGEPIEEPLRELASQEFLYEAMTGTGDVEHVFRHALTQEVAYQNLTANERARLHGAAGLALEGLYADRLDEVVELLAHHFGRSALDERAVDSGILAAEKAARRWATTEARTTFTAVLGRLDRMPRSHENLLRRLDAVLKQAEVRFALGEHQTQLQGLAAVRDIAEEIADPPRRAAWLYWTGFLQSVVGGPPEAAIAHCRQAASLVEATGHQELRPFADCCLAHVYFLAGDLREAMAAGERALPELEARGNVWWACRTIWALSPAANALGSWMESLQYCERALHHGEVADDLRLKIVAWSRIAGTQVQRGDPKAALAACDVAGKLGPTPYDTAMVGAVRGYALVKSGEIAAGLAHLGEAVEWFASSRLVYTRSQYSLWLAESLVRSGDRDAGRARAAAALEASRSIGYRYLEGVALRIVGESRVLEEPPAAAADLQRAQELLEAIGARNELAKTLAAQATVRVAVGALTEARNLLGEALAIFDALDTIDEAARVRAALQVMPPDGNA